MILVGDISSNWYQTIAKISEQARKASKPFQFVIGTVEEESPLSIRKSKKLVLPQEFLILSNTVQDHEVEVEITGSDGVKEKQKMLIKNSLKKDEKVLMLQQEGGQMYFVVDRIKEG